MKKEKLLFAEASSGIHIENDNTSNTQKLSKTAFINTLAQFAVLLMAVCGAVFTFSTMMGSTVNTNAVFIGCAMFAAISTVLYKYIKRSWIIVLCSLGIFIITGILMWPILRSAAPIIYEDCRIAIAEAMYWSIPKRSIELTSDTTMQVTYIYMYASAIISVFVGYFTCARVHFLGIFLLTFPFFEIGAAFGCVPSHLAFAIMIGSWAAGVTLHFANRQKIKVQNKSVNNKSNNKKFASKKLSGKFAASAAVTGVAVILIFLIIETTFSIGGFSRNDTVNNARISIKNSTSDIIDYITGVDHDGSLKDGKLSSLGDRKIKDRHYLTVTMPYAMEDIYIKGYGGDVYTGSEWKQLDNYSDYNALFNQFEDICGVEAAEVSSALLARSKESTAFGNGQFIISNLRRTKDYAYTAYYPIASETVKADGDSGFTVTNKSKYSYYSYFELDSIYNIYSSDLINSDEFKRLWADYSSYVYNEYTDTIDSEKIKEITDSFGELNYAKAVDTVRKYLLDNTEYSLSCSPMPLNSDFVEYFLLDQKKGYSAHYASAAAVMLRECGVPTRYVEGYLITSETIEAAEFDKDNGISKVVEVTDRYAHAWIEVFSDKYGWLPVDVTPGFYDESFSDYINQLDVAVENVVTGYKEYITDLADEPSATPDEDSQQPTDSNNIPIYSTDYSSPEGVDNNEGGDKFGALKDPIFYLSIVIALFVVAVVAYIITFSVLRKRRELRLMKLTPKERISEAFSYMTKLLKFDGIDTNILSYTKFFEDLSDNYTLLGENFNEIAHIFILSGFSDTEITKEQADTVVSFVLDYRKTLKKQAKLSRRFIMVFIRMI